MIDPRACEKAFKNMQIALKPGVFLPDSVFQGSWNHFLFMESDQLFIPSFVEAVHEFLNAEPAQAVCLRNLSRQVGTEFDECSAVCLNGKTTWSDYEKLAR
jgi:hypothetical protein